MIMKIHTFLNFLLEHEDFESGKSFVSCYNDFDQSK